MHVLECMNFDSNFTEVCYCGSIYQYPSIGSDNGLAPAGAKPLSEPMLVSLLAHICVTGPQWVNTMDADTPCALPRQAICNSGIDHAGLTVPCLPRWSISTVRAISVLEIDRNATIFLYFLDEIQYDKVTGMWCVLLRVRYKLFEKEWNTYHNIFKDGLNDQFRNDWKKCIFRKYLHWVLFQ